MSFTDGTRWHIDFYSNATAWTVSYLKAAGYFSIGRSISIVHGLIAGASGSEGGFGLGNLWIRYGMRSGGLLGERLTHVVIAPAFPEDQKYDGSTNAYTLVFAGGNLVTIRPHRGETIWIDEQWHVTSLDRALTAQDITALEKSSSRKRHGITSAEEFLAIIARLRAEPAAPGKPSTAGR